MLFFRNIKNLISLFKRQVYENLVIEILVSYRLEIWKIREHEQLRFTMRKKGLFLYGTLMV